MDSDAGEWLYRATVGLIWYFSWFNVSEGRTRGRSLIYHGFMAADGVVLLATWWAYRDPALTRPYDHALAAALPASYLTGLALKALYYYRFHPKLGRRRTPPALEMLDSGAVGFRNFAPDQGSVSSSPPPPPPPPPPLLNARMYRHAAHFYSVEAVGSDRGGHEACAGFVI